MAILDFQTTGLAASHGCKMTWFSLAPIRLTWMAEAIVSFIHDYDFGKEKIILYYISTKFSHDAILAY